jgi:hypothetical protein
VKAVFLAAAMTIAYLLALTVGFRLLPAETLRARFMVRLFLLTLPASVAIHYVTPDNLGFLPVHWYETGYGVDLWFFLFLYSACFFGGLLQLYNLADRGFSLRIVIDIDNSPTGYMTVDEVVDSYSSGRGIEWMYQKRIDDLARLNLIAVDKGMVSPTLSGSRMASRFSWLRRFLKVAAQG